MRKACFYVNNSIYDNNRIFALDDQILNRDNWSYYFYLLKKYFETYNINLSTQSINNIIDSDIIIYMNIPENQKILLKKNINKSYTILFENELKKNDWNLDNHKYFKKIFTWNDDLVDNKKYFKFNYSFKIPKEINKSFKNKKLCTLIAGNHIGNNSKELYSKRREAIRWFEKYHINDFDLYGIGWNEFKTRNRYINYGLRKLKIKMSSNKYKSYKGKINRKKDILEKYKFSICYENLRDVPGYITEKIFDCFFSGCVPIYWGANNITEHIPQNCFIDKRRFSTYAELYKFIKNMKEEIYSTYLDNIETFLNSDKIKQFSAEYFASSIAEEILQKI